MARQRYNNAVGLLGASLGTADTAITFQSNPGFATLAAGDYVPLILDPPAGSSPNANFEIVYLTAYTSGATTGTISRAQEGTTAQTHASSSVWRCGPTARDAAWLLRNVNPVTASGAAQTVPEPWVATENRIVLSASCTLTFPAAAMGKEVFLALQQDATGGRSVTWPTNIKWPAGTSPTLSAGANLTDYFRFVCLDGTNWLGITLGQGLKINLGPVLTGQSSVVGANLSAGNNVTITVPATTLVGDTILLFVMQGNLPTGGNTPTTPTGYSPVLTNIHTTSASRNVAMSLFSKTAVAGDIGANVTIAVSTGDTNNVIHMRSYTCGGIDTSASATATTGTSLSPPTISTSQAAETVVSAMMGGSNGGITSSSLGSGGQNTDFWNGFGFGSAWVLAAAEEFAIAAAGGSPTGGAITEAGGSGTMAFAGISVSLKPAAG